MRLLAARALGSTMSWGLGVLASSAPSQKDLGIFVSFPPPWSLLISVLAFFLSGFLLALTQGRETQAQNSFSSFTLMKLRHSSALGGASLGARHIGHHLPMDYNVNAIAFYSYTFS